MLRVALPNKGSLSDPAARMMSEAGYRAERSAKELRKLDPVNDTEFFFLRPHDIAIHVAGGRLDAGITGRDLLIDSAAAATEVVSLGFAAAVFRLAGPAGRYRSAADLAGRRIATTYPTLVEKYLAERGVSAEIVRLDGAVEIAVELGVADAIADVVETGATLRATGMEPIGEPILRSEAVLIRPSASDVPAGLDRLIRRLESVIVARTYQMIDYNIPASLLDDAVQRTPGMESPTVSTLADPAWVAVRAMVPARETHQVMDDLAAIGAKAILVTDIHACRI
ncbi:MAG: ATP phosphoribosyltransferase [Acidimicrobiales bacterium]